MTETSVIITAVPVIAFVVNITVQITKNLIPIPSKLWTLAVSVLVTTVSVFAASERGLTDLSVTKFAEGFTLSFVVAYIAMYGFDTFRELWIRFKDGGNINEEKE